MAKFMSFLTFRLTSLSKASSRAQQDQMLPLYTNNWKATVAKKENLIGLFLKLKGVAFIYFLCLPHSSSCTFYIKSSSNGYSRDHLWEHTHTQCVHTQVNLHRQKGTDGVNLQPQIGCLADSQAQNNLK